MNGTTLKSAKNVSPGAVRLPIETELLRAFANGAGVITIYKNPCLQEACRVYEQTLKTVGLLPSQKIQRARVIRLLLAWFVLLAVALVKIFLAVSSGHMNIVFLIILMIAAAVIAWLVSFPRLTQSGKTMIADLRSLHSGLRDRSLSLQRGGASIETMMLAAVFGVGALEGAGFSFTRWLFPRAAKDQSGSSCASATCGSSCGGGSSCGSSCGGGCGGCGGS